MDTVCFVRTIPVRDQRGEVLGWVRVDPFADGSKDTDQVFLRDGSVCGQVVAMKRITQDASLLWPTENQAAGDGLRDLWAAAHGPIGTR